MAEATRVALTAFRNDPLCLTVGIEEDLTGATVKFCVRQYADQPGDPLLGPITGTGLAVSLEPIATGIRLVEVTFDDDGVPLSVIEITDTKAHVQALPSAFDAGEERGSDLTFHHDIERTLSEEAAAPFSAVEQTKLFGDFILKGSANG